MLQSTHGLLVLRKQHCILGKFMKVVSCVISLWTMLFYVVCHLYVANRMYVFINYTRSVYLCTCIWHISGRSLSSSLFRCIHVSSPRRQLLQCCLLLGPVFTHWTYFLCEPAALRDLVTGPVCVLGSWECLVPPGRLTWAVPRDLWHSVDLMRFSM